MVAKAAIHIMEHGANENDNCRSTESKTEMSVLVQCRTVLGYGDGGGGRFSCVKFSTFVKRQNDQRGGGMGILTLNEMQTIKTCRER